MNTTTPTPREPLFNAPWPAVAIPVALCVAFGLQLWAGDQAFIARLALSADALRAGRLETLLSHIFVHGGWTHLIMNALAAFAFGPPVARHFGMTGRGIAAFYLFFLLCGALSGLGYVLVHWNSPALIVGASGAISGLWGGASRLLGRKGLKPPRDRNVVTQAIAFLLLNVAIGLLGPFMIGVSIAWEAHVAGYLAGLLLIGPFARIAGR
jgi:membrane associated rhomboid family serine protease